MTYFAPVIHCILGGPKIYKNQHYQDLVFIMLKEPAENITQNNKWYQSKTKNILKSTQENIVQDI